MTNSEDITKPTIRFLRLLVNVNTRLAGFGLWV